MMYVRKSKQAAALILVCAVMAFVSGPLASHGISAVMLCMIVAISMVVLIDPWSVQAKNATITS